MGLTTLIPTVETHRERQTRLTKEAIRAVMMTITHDPAMHAEVIAQGPLAWRNIFLREMRGFRVDESIADKVYVALCETWKHQWGETPADVVIQAIEPPRPPSEKEIEDAWEHDPSSSSWEARRQFYRDFPSKLPIEITSVPAAPSAKES